MFLALVILMELLMLMLMVGLHRLLTYGQMEVLMIHIILLLQILITLKLLIIMVV